MPPACWLLDVQAGEQRHPPAWFADKATTQHANEKVHVMHEVSLDRESTQGRSLHIEKKQAWAKKEFRDKYINFMQDESCHLPAGCLTPISTP
jgi:hypothetical protein